MSGVAPIAAVLPLIPAVVTDSPSSDPYTLLMQLGVGGVLVAFAVWLQDKMSKERRREVEEERLLTKERTDQLIEALKAQIPEEDK